MPEHTYPKCKCGCDPFPFGTTPEGRRVIATPLDKAQKKCLIESYIERPDGRTKLIASFGLPLQTRIDNLRKTFDPSKPTGVNFDSAKFQRRLEDGGPYDMLPVLFRTVSKMAPEERQGEPFKRVMTLVEEYRMVLRQSMTCAKYIDAESYGRLSQVMQQRYSPLPEGDGHESPSR